VIPSVETSHGGRLYKQVIIETEDIVHITVRLLASYRQYLPRDHDAQAGYQVPLPPAAQVSDVLAELPIPSGDVFTFFVNGRHAQRDQILQEGDILSVFPAVGGG
jgi:sulfur carrier protein ThiS